MADTSEPASVIVAFRTSRQVAEAAEAIAAREGLSRADVVRRALLRDLAQSPPTGSAA